MNDCGSSWAHGLVLFGYALMAVAGGFIGTFWWAAIVHRVPAATAIGLCAVCLVVFIVGAWCVWTFG